MSYIVRTYSGVPKIVLTNGDAATVISKLDGFFKSAVTKAGTEVTVFEVTEDAMLSYGSINLCFNKKDYFISSKVDV